MATFQAGIAIDVGQSSTKLLTIERSGTSQSIRFAPAGVALVGTTETDTLANHLLKCLNKADRSRAEALTIGLSGYRDDRALLKQLVAHLRKAVPDGPIIVADDAWTGLLGAIGKPPGVVVTSGTGAVALAATTNGRWAKADGRGHLLGDTGSGFWIGSSGARAALEALDGSGPPTSLAEALVEGPDGADELIRSIYSAKSPVAALASLVPVVAAHAQAGDSVATQILSNAATGLALSARAAAANAGLPVDATRVSYVGGTLKGVPLLVEFTNLALQKLLPGCHMIAPQGSPLSGAARLLRERASLCVAGLTHCDD